MGILLENKFGAIDHSFKPFANVANINDDVLKVDPSGLEDKRVHEISIL